MLAGQLEKRGIHLLPATRLEGIHTEKGRVSTVSLQGGRSLPCELLLAAVGVRPDTRLAQEAGLTVQRGIVVDSYLQSSDPFIYAAGDVVESPDALSGQSIVFATWPNAVEQGRLAAANMLGLRQAISPCVTMNSVELAGVPLISFGDILGGPQDTIWTQEKSGVYHKLVLRNDVLRGALCFGDVCRAGVLGTMVLRQSSVVGMDLRAPHFNYAQLLTL